MKTLLELDAAIQVPNRHHRLTERPNTFYIGRGSAVGNPYPVEQYGRLPCINLYKGWLRDQIAANNTAVNAYLNQIAAAAIYTTDGARLLCFCSPKPCHGDVIKATIIQKYSDLWDQQPRKQCRCKRGHLSKYDGKCANCRTNREDLLVTNLRNSVNAQLT